MVARRAVIFSGDVEIVFLEECAHALLVFNINEERSPIISPGIVLGNYKESYAVYCYICGRERGLQLPALSSLHCASMINEMGS